MNRTTSLLFLLVMLAATAFAQNKRIKQITEEYTGNNSNTYLSTLSVDYDEQGRVTRIVREGGDRTVTTATYDGNVIHTKDVCYYDGRSEEEMICHYTITDGRLTKMEYDEGDMYFTVNVEYTDNRMTHWVYDFDYDGMMMVMEADIVWEDGNVSETKTYWQQMPEREDTHAYLTSSDLTASPVMRCMFGMGFMSDNNFEALGLYRYYGTLPRNLMSALKSVENSSSGLIYEINRAFDYKFDSEGNVVEVTDLYTEDGYKRTTVYHIDWEDDVASISSVTGDSKQTEKWFTLSGQQLPAPPTGHGIYLCAGKKVIR